MRSECWQLSVGEKMPPRSGRSSPLCARAATESMQELLLRSHWARQESSLPTPPSRRSDGSSTPRAGREAAGDPAGAVVGAAVEAAGAPPTAAPDERPGASAQAASATRARASTGPRMSFGRNISALTPIVLA
ncbi:protein of unknown function [Azospirillum baldaniorum]|uniref:Uncharacterized protein n=1 Tax=Azospirillum baldaniorum TaxID=1064539 RepID=A0A9P1NLR3_9PROT|nr:protein of unknown function [Azospirillum baldaniorum]